VDDLIAISRIYWDLGSYEVSQKILKSILPRTKTAEQRVMINASLGRFFKKMGHSNEAIQYWQEAAENGDAAACIELAMYYEHSIKDYSTALHWCEKGLQASKNGDKNPASSRFLISTQKRMTRLQFKRSNHV
jgi:TPR repeat protein